MRRDTRDIFRNTCIAGHKFIGFGPDVTLVSCGPNHGLELIPTEI